MITVPTYIILMSCMNVYTNGVFFFIHSTSPCLAVKNESFSLSISKPPGLVFLPGKGSGTINTIKSINETTM